MTIESLARHVLVGIVAGVVTAYILRHSPQLRAWMSPTPNSPYGS